MAWTAPMTWADGSVLTAAQLNLHLRDNLLETMPSKMSATSNFLVADKAGHLGEHTPKGDTFFSSVEYTNSEEYTDLATEGPSVTVTTGPAVFVLWSTQITNEGDGTVHGGTTDNGQKAIGYCSLQIEQTGGQGLDTGEENVVLEASDAQAVIRQGQDNGTPPSQIIHASHHMMIHDITGEGEDAEGETDGEDRGGEYRFILKYRSEPGGSAQGWSGFQRRELFVWPMS